MACGDVERREGIVNCKTDRKLAKMLTMLTSDLKRNCCDWCYISKMFGDNTKIYPGQAPEMAVIILPIML